MKRTILFFMVLTFSAMTFSCSSDDDSSNNLRNVEIVLTEGRASFLKVVPSDEKLTNYSEDELEYEDVNQISFTLPNYAHHFYLTIQGTQQSIKGYVKINGQTWEFQTLDWYYQGVYYLSDFE